MRRNAKKTPDKKGTLNSRVSWKHIIADWVSKINLPLKLIGGTCVLLGGVIATIEIYGYCNPPKQLTDRDRFDSEYIDSALKPPKINTTNNLGYIELETPPIFAKGVDDRYPKIVGIKIIKNEPGEKKLIAFHVGNRAFTVTDSTVRSGIKIPLPTNGKCYPSFISFGLKDDRIYVSTEFKDLLNEETIGVIEYNRWRLYKKNMFNYYNTDEKLEVIDRQNNVVFSIKFQLGLLGSNTIIISGYFINPYSVSFLSCKNIQYIKDREMVAPELDTCIDKSRVDWKQKSLELASKIKRIFPD